MTSIGRTLTAMALAGLLPAGPRAHSPNEHARPPAPASPGVPGAQLPLVFVPVPVGSDGHVRYSAHARGARFDFTQREATLVFENGTRSVALRLEFVGANAWTQLAGSRQAAATMNYLIGSDPSKWRTGVATYEEVVYRDLWPGIDLAFRGGQGELKYEFRVAPGADPGSIRLRYRGAVRLTVDSTGDLLVHTPVDVIRDSRPVTYQTVAGERVAVPSRYALGSRSYGFELGSYDRSQPLVIDPGLVYSTFVGGQFNDSANGIVVSADGSVYIAGSTQSANFPTTPEAFDTTYGGGGDAFVSKLDPTGSTLLYSTFLGGNNADTAWAIAIDAAGSVYVTGRTTSTDFPTTPGAFDTIPNAGDAFVTKLDATGNVVYSTRLGGSFDDTGSAIAVDASGNAFVTGGTASSNFPTTSGAFDTAGGNGDAFVTKLDPSGASLVYSTYLGAGGSVDQGSTIALGMDGSAYVAGSTDPNSLGGNAFPTTPGAFDRQFNGGLFNGDGFVTKLDPTGSTLVYSTFLGGTSDDDALDLAVDADGNVYVSGVTTSTDFPTTAGAFRTQHIAGGDVFVTKLNADGSALVYSTYLPGTGGESGQGIAVDATGHAYVVGTTNSIDFPTTPDAFDATRGGGTDAFVSRLDPAGSLLRYSTYLGASRNDSGFDIALDSNGGAYATGHAFSPDFPTTPGAYDRIIGQHDFTDAFIAKFDIGNDPADVGLSPPDATNLIGTNHTVIATVVGVNGQPLADVNVLITVTGAGATSGMCTTDSAGQCSFTYPGPTTPGTDEILGVADVNQNGVDDSWEPRGTATKAWVDTDQDDDGVGDQSDNCVAVPNPDQTNTDGDAEGDACDADDDNDGVGDADDAFPLDLTEWTDSDGDGIGNNADTDDDNDGVPDSVDAFPLDPTRAVVLTVAPETATNPLDTEHCVTATVTGAGAAPVPDLTVRFTVTGATTTSGSESTEANGEAVFCYAGPVFPGDDTIAVHVDVDNDGTIDAPDATGSAAKSWTLPESTPATVAGIGLYATASAADAVFFGLSANSAEGTLTAQCLVADREANVVFFCLNAVSIVRTGTGVTIYGVGLINNEFTGYRIEVEDLGPFGSNLDNFRIQTTSGYTSDGALLWGDVLVQ